jgi:hypothetical protein
MSDKTINDGLLVAYADGQLSDDDIAIVEEAMRLNPLTRAQVDKYKKSGTLLKSAMDIENQVTPDHIAFKIREIEHAAKKKQQSEFVTLPRQSIFSLSFLSSIGGSFVAGLACAVLIISPSLLTVNNDLSSSSPAPQTQQLVMRGVDQFMAPYIKQLGVEIAHEGSIQAGKPFEVVYKSPISGRLKISEVSENTIPIIRVLMAILDLDVTEYLDATITAGSYGQSIFTIEDQETLHFRIEFSNDVTTITHDIVFKVAQ